MIFILSRAGEPLPGFRAFFSLLAAVSTEGAGLGELPQLVPHHVLADVDRDELRPVVHRDRVPDHVGDDRRAPGPGLDHPLLAAVVHRRHLLLQVIVDEITLLERTRHRLPPVPAGYFWLRRRTIMLAVRLLLRVL